MLLTFFDRISAKSRSRLSPTRWPKRSLTSLNRSRSASARQKSAPVRRAFSSSSASAASKLRRFPIMVTGSRIPASSDRSRSFCSCSARSRDSSSSLRRFASLSRIVAIVLDESEHDLVGRSGLRVLRQPARRAVKTFGKRVAVRQMGLDELRDRAQQPIDRLDLLNGFSPFLPEPACSDSAPIVMRPIATPSAPETRSSTTGKAPGRSKCSAVRASAPKRATPSARNRDAARAKQQERVHEPPNSLKKRRLDGQRLAMTELGCAERARPPEELASLVTDGFGRPSWPPVH